MLASRRRGGTGLMIAASIALTWIALSAASVIGLSALARAAAMSNAEFDLAQLTLEDEQHAHRSYAFDARWMARAKHR